MTLQPEQIEHINIVNWFSHNYPDLANDLHHFANERKCSMIQGKILKRMGVKKGVADFFLALPLDGYSGFWLELKVGKNRLSPDQQEFMKRKTQRGYLCAVCWGFEDAKELFITYLRNYKENSSENALKKHVN